MWDLVLCPLRYKDNCANAEVMCSSCAAANLDETSLKYRPLEDIGPHPYIEHIKRVKAEQRLVARKAKKESESFKKARSRTREGRKIENKVISNIPQSIKTFTSGSKFGDGDAKIRVGDKDLYIEHKARLNSKNLRGPTKSEWEKAKGQGVEIFITSSKELGSVVTMPIETLNHILQCYYDRS